MLWIFPIQCRLEGHPSTNELPLYTPPQNPPPYFLPADFFVKVLQSRANNLHLKDPHEDLLSVKPFDAHPRLISKWFNNWTEFLKTAEPESGDILEQQIMLENGEREYRMFVYVGGNTAITVGKSKDHTFSIIQKIDMNENAKPIPIRFNNGQKSLYPSFPLDLSKERATSQETNFPLPVNVTSEEFVNWVVFSKLVSPMKERLGQLRKSSKSKKNGAGTKINVRLQIFVYQSCSPGTVGKSCEYCAPNPYVNIVDVVSDSLASDSNTAKRDREIGVSNLEPETKQERHLLLFTQTKIQGIKKRRQAQDMGFINITMNVHSSEKLWFIVGYDHKSPTVTYFIDLGRDLFEIQSKMLLLRTNPVQNYGVDWLPRLTDVTNDNDPFYVEFRAIASKRATEEHEYLVGKLREIYREGAK